MVSIHRVPVIAYLIIRVIYFTFRFKREAPELLPAPRSEAPENCPVSRSEQRRSPTPICITILYTDSSIGVRIHQWLSSIEGMYIAHPRGIYRCLVFDLH